MSALNLGLAHNFINILEGKGLNEDLARKLAENKLAAWHIMRRMREIFPLDEETETETWMRKNHQFTGLREANELVAYAPKAADKSELHMKLDKLLLHASASRRRMMAIPRMSLRELLSCTPMTIPIAPHNSKPLFTNEMQPGWAVYSGEHAVSNQDEIAELEIQAHNGQLVTAPELLYSLLVRECFGQQIVSNDFVVRGPDGLLRVKIRNGLVTPSSEISIQQYAKGHVIAYVRSLY